MPKSARPRKRYVPRSVGKPITSVARDSLVTTPYLALSTLQYSTDVPALKEACDNLGAALNTAHAALQLAGQSSAVVDDGLAAMLAMLDRAERTKVMRPTGPELTKMRAALVFYDDRLGTLKTHHLVGAIHEIDRLLDQQAEEQTA